MNFLRCNSLDQDRKSVLMDMMDGLAAGKLESGGMAAVVLLSRTASAALQNIKDRTTPSPPSQANPRLHDWHCMTPGPVKCAAAQTSPGRIISACFSRADGCLSGRKLWLSQGGREELLWITNRLGMCSFASLCCFYWSEELEQSPAVPSREWQESWNSRSAAIGINGLKAFPYAAAAQHSVPSADKNEIGSVFTCNAGYAPINPCGCWRAHGTAALLPPIAAQQAVFQRKPPCSATASLLHSSGWKMFSLMVHQEPC